MLSPNLDPTDFQIAVDNKQATFARAEKDYERGKKLVKEGHISKRDFDGLEAAFLTSRAEFNLAKQQLDYTELKAPFDGVIARRHIQSFEEVEAKQSIVTLNDNEILEVKFDLPEIIMAGLAFASVLTLVFVPVMYAIFFKIDYRQEV